MGWNVVFVLHLFCGMAAMTGVHSQGDSTSGNSEVYQEFEGEAVHSIMQSWVEAGTNSSWLTNDANDGMGWSLTEHPCNGSRWWQGVSCNSKLIEPYGSTLKNTYYFLTSIDLSMNWNGSRGWAEKIVGGLPPAILNLTNLESLYIYDVPQLSGSLPPGIFCSLYNLKTLSLTSCSLNGNISIGFTPGCTWNTGLAYLDLSGNSFTSLDTGTFGYLQHLNVSNNKLKGEVQLDGWSLEIADLSNNFITDISFIGLEYNVFKSIYVQNNSIVRFPKELLKSKTLQNIILDSNQITGELHLPNISCQNSRIKLISLLYNKITGFYPSNDPSSCFNESRILFDNKIFLGGNLICTNPSLKRSVPKKVYRFNASSPIEADEPNMIIKKTNKILIIIIASVSPMVVFASIMAFFVIQRLKKKISMLREFQNELDKKDVKPNLYSFTKLKIATQDFHTRNELGQGGFGIVYKVYV